MSQNQGYADIVLGLQYGDEGKARVVDMIAKDYDVIARFNGGANAGHTVENEHGKIALNQVPSGIFYPDKQLYTGSGCVIDMPKLAAEIAKIEERDISLTGRYHISSQVSLVQPHHLYLDAKMGGKIGTTKKGIGPCYADKAFRMDEGRLTNIRIGDVAEDADKFFGKMKDNLLHAIKLHGLEVTDPDKDIAEQRAAFEKVKQYVQPDTLWIQKQAENGGRILFEGAQSAMLDVTKGSVPYVTSSNTIAAAAYFGGDLSPNFHRKTIGVAKALMSRVGFGPFTSEIGAPESEEYCMAANPDGSPTYGRSVEEQLNAEELIGSDDDLEVSKALRIRSHEYGTVSTRPRRVGAFDLIQLSYTMKMNGVTELFITKCDLLREFHDTKKQSIPLVTAYTLDDKTIDYVPGSTDTYARVKPVGEELPGFPEDLTAMRTPEELPEAMHNFIHEVEKRNHCKVIGIGVGPGRDQYVTFQ
jgi:adenylosuccinate synthase